ncbi:MAG TPA: HD domain-containing phosphohydrolase [Bryobacteraceae bacterium]
MAAAARAGLRASLRDQQHTVERLSAKSDEQSRRSLAVMTENPALKAGMALLRNEPDRENARLTVADQLLDVGSSSSFDLLLVSDTEGHPLAGVIREGDRLSLLEPDEAPPSQSRIFVARGRVFRMASANVVQNGEMLGRLSAGDEFQAAALGVPAVLEREGKVVQSSVPGVSAMALEAFFRSCGEAFECEGSLAGESYLAIRMGAIAPESGYSLRSLRSVDAACRPIQARLRRVFLIASFIGLALAVIVCMLSSRSVARPIERLVDHLRRCEARGDLREFAPHPEAVPEIAALTETFSRAAAAARQSRLDLRRAYLESVGSLASALDARDAYTAGHSARVSRFAGEIARALDASQEEVEIARIGALLHDIGKIGIADAVLQKPGRLTDEEFALLKQHPIVGRRILEGVHEFERYLPVVELHHENWDGSGYPYGQRREETPRVARIVHVADAYDAMTSDRPYRKGLAIEAAIAELRKWAGKQFDPKIVEVFVDLLQGNGTPAKSEVDEFSASLLRVGEAVGWGGEWEPAGRKA